MKIENWQIGPIPKEPGLFLLHWRSKHDSKHEGFDVLDQRRNVKIVGAMFFFDFVTIRDVIEWVKLDI